MSLLYLKNIFTFYILVWFWLSTVASNAVIGAPNCQVYSNGVMFFGCGTNSSVPNDALATTKVPLYDFAYVFTFFQAIIFLFISYVHKNFRNPFKFRNERLTQNISFDDLNNEVAAFLKLKIDIKYVLIDAAKHVADIVHTIAEMVLCYYFSVSCALSMGYSWREAKQAWFPSVKRCYFHHWPHQVQCEVRSARVFNAVFSFMCFWYAITSLIVLLCIAVKIRRYIQTRRTLKETYFTKMEAWLFDMCKDKMVDLNEMARKLGKRNFENVAGTVVLDPRVGKYASKQFFYNLAAEGATATNSEVIAAHPWTSHPL